MTNDMLPNLIAPPRSMGRQFLLILLMGAILYAGFLIAGALENSAELMGPGGVPEMAFFGLLVSPFMVPVLGLIAYLPFAVIGWWRKRPVGWRWMVGVALGVGMVFILRCMGPPAEPSICQPSHGPDARFHHRPPCWPGDEL